MADNSFHNCRLLPCTPPIASMPHPSGYTLIFLCGSMCEWDCLRLPMCSPFCSWSLKPLQSVTYAIFHTYHLLLIECDFLKEIYFSLKHSWLYQLVRFCYTAKCFRCFKRCKRLFVVSSLFNPQDCSYARFLCPWNSPGKILSEE